MSHFSVDGKTQLFGIIGNPVNHSFSPAMQTKGFQEMGINAVYLPFTLQEKDLGKALGAFSLLGIRGFNVTVPFKEKIISYLDTVDSTAKITNSVNTVYHTKEGWKGTSTDGEGFVRSILKKNVVISNSKVLLFGAGGSAMAIAHSLVQYRIKTLHICNRTAEKAIKLGKTCQQQNPTLEIKVNPKTVESYDIMINCTTVGMQDKRCLATDDLVKRCGYIVDIIYNPRQTTLLKKAKQFKIPYSNGIGMLLYQGIAAFEIWTKRQAPVGVMRTSLLESLAKD